MSFATDIESAAQGEEIIGIVVGTFGGSTWNSNEADEEQYAWGRNDTQVPVPAEMKGRILKWDEIREYLDYNYDGGFGTEECHPITAWTENWVIVVGCYDGSTWVTNVPRNPRDHATQMIGGG